MSTTAYMQQKDFTEDLSLPASLNLTPESFSFRSFGGAHKATIRVTGNEIDVTRSLEWLRNPIFIDNNEEGTVWWGFVHDVDLSYGVWTIGLSLDKMANKVKTVYNEPVISGSSTKKETDWVQDNDSLSHFGIKEQRLTASDATLVMAEAKRDQHLELFSRPMQQRRMQTSANVQATLRCVGWLETLKWQYYAQPLGFIANTATSQSKTQKLGLGLTAATIGFNEDKRTIHDRLGRLGNFKKDDQIYISGATDPDNNGLFTVEQGTDKTAVTITGTQYGFKTVSGDPQIYDNTSGGGLAALSAGDMLYVTGATNSANNGYYFALSATSDGKTVVVDRAVITELGASITIVRGNAIRVVETTLVDEYPSATVTIKVRGEAIRQKFISNGHWLAGELNIRAKKIGTPVDLLRISIYSDVGGNPSAELVGISIDPADMNTSIDWLQAVFATPYMLADATSYMIVIARTGSDDPSNYYEIGVDESLGYPDGALRLKINGVWSTATDYARVPDADLQFRVIGYEETTEQIHNILTDCCQFLASVVTIDDSGIYAPMYRDGTLTADKELEKLLSYGCDDQRRIIITVDKNRVAKITKEPVADTQFLYLLDKHGDMRDYLDNPVPLVQALVNVWAEQDIIPVTVNTSMLASVSPAYVEEHEVNLTSGRRRIQFRGERNPYDLVEIRNA